MSKKVLLIGGGGTLGTHTYAELLRLGHRVDVICLEDYMSDNENLKFIKATADLEYLTEFLKDKHYDGIVNFIHYTSTEAYKPVHMLLSSKTDQLVFLSSYRVYADEQHPLTETAPQLLDTVKDDEEFLKIEDYAIPKSKNELFIKNESNTTNWTIVRPVISFSERRFDVVLTGGRTVVDSAKSGEVVLVPEIAKNLTAGLDWSGNSGKLIANLLFKKDALGEAFTISSGQNLTWGEIANIYTDILGTKFEWVSVEDYLSNRGDTTMPYILKYDRLYNRDIDCSKVMKVTGLDKSDFKSIRDGIIYELSKINK